MKDINRVILIGRITRDVDSAPYGFGYTAAGICKAVISIAVNRQVKRGDSWEEETSYLDVILWGKSAENLRPYLTKGQQIAVEAYLKQDRWEKDGKTQSKIDIIADDIQLLGSKKESNSANENHKQKAKQNYQQAYQQEEFPEDIPF